MYSSATSAAAVPRKSLYCTEAIIVVNMLFFVCSWLGAFIFVCALGDFPTTFASVLRLIIVIFFIA